VAREIGRNLCGRSLTFAAVTLETNEFGQALGFALRDWTPRPRPERTTIAGRYCTLEPLNASTHADDLFDAYLIAPDGSDWTYLPSDRFTDRDAYRVFAAANAATEDPMHFAIVDRRTGKAVGTASLLRIDPANGSIEVGWIAFSPLIQRTPMGTEAMFLLMRYCMDDLGYRRYEWKCNALNEPSRRAALRYGFQFEGVFRQAAVVKQRNRDTAWYAFVDGDWPIVKAAFEQWLDPANFDADGQQRSSLSSFRP
jgi:RimJ/RimL family protein N-acetyltransferase